MFVELFGFGGDGKTTICNLILSMLGSSDFGLEIQFNNHGKIETFSNPCGLGCTIQTFSILNHSKEGHNEGGIINLPGKRFCTLQEPDSTKTGNKLNVSMIKEMTGGNTMVARKIYKEASSFKPNCLILLQTNSVLGYSEDDNEALRRRMCVVSHHAKFYSEKNKHRLQNLEFSKMIDPSIGEMIRNDVFLWQAAFYILLPYAVNLRKKPISGIEMPASIRDTTEDSFNDAASINGFFNTKIQRSENKVISFLVLRDMIIEENDKNKDEPGCLLKAKQRLVKKKEASMKIFNKFIGNIYKLKKDFLKNPLNEASGPADNITVEFLNSGENNVRNYFSSIALNNETNIQASITFLIDYELKERIDDY
jgi:hypothetical protein